MNHLANDLVSIFSILGIPEEIRQSYEKLGFSKLYDWQRDCLCTTNVLRGENLVYCAPTSGGKTLVAELVMFKTVLSVQMKAIFVLPYVSLVLEKEKHLKKMIRLLNRSGSSRFPKITIKSYYGDKALSRSFREQIIVCTIEKANSIFNSMMMKQKAHEIGSVIFDESHAVGNALNGYILEILMTKLLYYHKQKHTFEKPMLNTVSLLGEKQASIPQPLLESNLIYHSKIQIIALSATMGNIEEVASWLHAKLFITSFRPIPLQEYIVCQHQVMDTSGICMRMLSPASIPTSSFAGTVTGYQKDQLMLDTIQCLCEDGLRSGQQILLFGSSRNLCSILCKHLSSLMQLCSHTNAVASRYQLPPSVLNMLTILQQNNSNMPQTNSKGQDKSASFMETLFAIPLGISPIEKLIKARLQVLQYMQDQSPSYYTIDPILQVSILYGIAYHHAGLSTIERQSIEQAFRQGYISILIATTTLAAGVNLPAGRVIIQSLMLGKDMLNSVHYKQMTGRAGRAGQTTYGESYLLVKPMEREKAFFLIHQPLPNITSQLSPQIDGGNGMFKAVIEILGLQLCHSVKEIFEWFAATLYYQQQLKVSTFSADAQKLATTSIHEQQVEKDKEILLFHIQEIIVAIVKFLLNTRIIEIPASSMHQFKQQTVNQNTVPSNIPLEERKLQITKFGQAMIRSNLDPDEAIVIYQALSHAYEQGIYLQTNLHLLYLITPLDMMTHQPQYTDSNKLPSGLHPQFRKLLQLYDQASKSRPRSTLSSLKTAAGSNSKGSANVSAVATSIQFQSTGGFCDLFEGIGLSYECVNKWCFSPPKRIDYEYCSSAVKLSGIYNWFNQQLIKINSLQSAANRDNTEKKPAEMKPSISLQEANMLAWSKRFWYSIILSKLLDGYTTEQVSREFGLDPNIAKLDLENLQQTTRMMASKIQRFCQEMEWVDLANMIIQLKELLDSKIPKEMAQLLAEVPLLSRKVAKVLIENQITNRAELLSRRPEDIVQYLQLSLGFELQDISDVNNTFEVDESKRSGNPDEKSANVQLQSASSSEPIKSPMTKDSAVRERLLYFTKCLFDSLKKSSDVSTEPRPATSKTTSSVNSLEEDIVDTIEKEEEIVYKMKNTGDFEEETEKHSESDNDDQDSFIDDNSSIASSVLEEQMVMAEIENMSYDDLIIGDEKEELSMWQLFHQRLPQPSKEQDINAPCHTLDNSSSSSSSLSIKRLKPDQDDIDNPNRISSTASPQRKIMKFESTAISSSNTMDSTTQSKQGQSIQYSKQNTPIKANQISTKAEFLFPRRQMLHSVVFSPRSVHPTGCSNTNMHPIVPDKQENMSIECIISDEDLVNFMEELENNGVMSSVTAVESFPVQPMVTGEMKNGCDDFDYIDEELERCLREAEQKYEESKVVNGNATTSAAATHTFSYVPLPNLHDTNVSTATATDVDNRMTSTEPNAMVMSTILPNYDTSKSYVITIEPVGYIGVDEENENTFSEHEIIQNHSNTTTEAYYIPPEEYEAWFHDLDVSTTNTNTMSAHHSVDSSHIKRSTQQDVNEKSLRNNDTSLFQMVMSSQTVDSSSIAQHYIHESKPTDRGNAFNVVVNSPEVDDNALIAMMEAFEQTNNTQSQSVVPLKTYYDMDDTCNEYPSSMVSIYDVKEEEEDGDDDVTQGTHRTTATTTSGTGSIANQVQRMLLSNTHLSPSTTTTTSILPNMMSPTSNNGGISKVQDPQSAERRNEKQPGSEESSLFYDKKSPYLTPFTPSKLVTPGKYLYLGMDAFSLLQGIPTLSASIRKASIQPSPYGDRYNKLGNNTAVPLLTASSSSTTAIPTLRMRYLHNPEDCQLFLQLLSTEKVFAFEPIFRMLPSHCVQYMNTNPTILSSWLPLVSFACNPLYNVTCTHNDLLLPEVTSYAQFYSKHPTKQQQNASNNSDTDKIDGKGYHVLVGMAFHFGGHTSNDCFVFRLPQLLPNRYTTTINAVPNNQQANQTMQKPCVITIEDIPNRCKEKICTFLGFPSFLYKSIYLYSYLECGVFSRKLSQITSNPLFSVSTSWNTICRQALLIEWRKGGALEWKFLQELFANDTYMKVSCNMKSKLKILRERNIIVQGRLHDPVIAHCLLQHGAVKSVHNSTTIPHATTTQGDGTKQSQATEAEEDDVAFTLWDDDTSDDEDYDEVDEQQIYDEVHSLGHNPLLASFPGQENRPLEGNNHTHGTLSMLQQYAQKLKYCSSYGTTTLASLTTTNASLPTSSSTNPIPPTTSSAASYQSILQHLLPHVYTSYPSPLTLQNLQNGWMVAGYRAMISLQVMERYEAQLLTHDLYTIYSYVEMPLCYSIADCEYTGISIDTSFYQSVRRQLMDRMEIIQRYFTHFFGVTNTNTTHTLPYAHHGQQQQHQQQRKPTTTATYHDDLDTKIDKQRVKQKILSTYSYELIQSCSMDHHTHHAGTTTTGTTKKVSSDWSAGKTKTSSSSSSTSTAAYSSQTTSTAIPGAIPGPGAGGIPPQLTTQSLILHHPIWKLLQEYRSHQRVLPLLSSLLSHQRWSRIHPSFHTLGTETGRCIASHPPVQQIPHECVFVTTKRPTLAEECSTWYEQYIRSTTGMMQSSQPLQSSSQPPQPISSQQQQQQLYNSYYSQPQPVQRPSQTQQRQTQETIPSSSTSSSSSSSIASYNEKRLLEFVKRINQQYALPIPSHSSSSSSGTSSHEHTKKVEGEWVKVLPLLPPSDKIIGNETGRNPSEFPSSSSSTTTTTATTTTSLAKIVCVFPLPITECYYQHISPHSSIPVSTTGHTTTTTTTSSTISTNPYHTNTWTNSKSKSPSPIHDYCETLLHSYQLRYAKRSLYSLYDTIQQQGIYPSHTAPTTTTSTTTTSTTAAAAASTTSGPAHQILQVLIMTPTPLPEHCYPFQYPILSPTTHPPTTHPTNTTTTTITNWYYYIYPANRLLRMNAKLLPYTPEYSLLSQSLLPGKYTSLDTLIKETQCWQSYQQKILLRQGFVATKTSQNTSKDTTSRIPQSAKPGYLFIVADYCQIELRILTHYLQDPTLLTAFQLSAASAASSATQQPQYDIFIHLAAHWKHRTYDEITPTERQEIKQLCYAILYGAGVRYIASALTIPETQARVFLQSFHTQFPRLKPFVSELQRMVREKGYVETLLGRKRVIYPDHMTHPLQHQQTQQQKQQQSGVRKSASEKSLSKKEEKKRHRQILNSLCQGSAADLIKLAMINIHHQLEAYSQSTFIRERTTKQRMSSSSSSSTQQQQQQQQPAGEKGLFFRYRYSHPGGALYSSYDDIRLLLQIHDELVYEVREDFFYPVAKIIKECMENAIVLENVPLQVKLSYGVNWAELQPIVFPTTENTTATVQQPQQQQQHHLVYNANIVKNLFGSE